MNDKPIGSCEAAIVRPSASVTLRNEAKRLVENAARLNQLADQLEHVCGETEETLNVLLSRGLSR